MADKGRPASDGIRRNLTGGENGVITLQAEYAPTFVTYEVQYYLQPDEKETDLQKYVAYYPQEEGQEKKRLQIHRSGSFRLP